jgi:hypothetical protein
MVKKIKVVDVTPVEAIEEVAPEPQPVEESQPVEETQPVEEVKEEVVVEDKPIEETKNVDASKKPLEYINCENCNKKVLMKTYKYSHQKVCKAKPAPPPPPAPEPTPKKERPKRAAKPKEKKEVPVEAPKPEFNGVVSFEMRPVVDPYLALRQDRVMARQQRVKSLISQAI